MKTKVKIWIMALTVGVAAGLVLATRLNVLAPTTAEQKTEESYIKVDEQALENAFVRVAEHVGPAVVSISTEHTEKPGGP